MSTLVLLFPVFGANSYIIYLGGGNLREMNMHNLLKHFRDVVMNYDLKKDTELRLYDWTLRHNTLVSDNIANKLNKIGIDLSSSKEDRFIVTLSDCTITRNGTNPYAMTFEVSFNVIGSLDKKIKSKHHASFFDEIVNYFNYLVRSEDSLEKLADRFLLDWEKWTDIARYNDIKNSDDIKVGDVRYG